MKAVSESIPSSPAGAFFSELEGCFRRACNASGSSPVHRYEVGGLGLELWFAGSALVDGFVPAFGHLPGAFLPGIPTLTVRIWDSVSTGVAMPSPPWSFEDFRERGEIRGFNNANFRTAFAMGSGVLNMIDLRRGEGVLWLRDAARLAYWESGAPLLTLLNWWFGLHGRQLVHAAAVGTPEGGALLVGKGGSGKSTTALSCLNSNLFYAADDYCLLEPDPEPRVHSLYNTGKLNRDNLDRFPQLGELFSAAGCRLEEKALVFLRDYCPEKISTGFPLKAVLLPRVTGTPRTSIVRISAAAGLKALAPSTIFQLSGAGAEAFAKVTRLVRRVPCYQLNLGTELEEIPRAIGRLLAGA